MEKWCANGRGEWKGPPWGLVRMNLNASPPPFAHTPPPHVMCCCPFDHLYVNHLGLLQAMHCCAFG
jgi:hypothetical protein